MVSFLTNIEAMREIVWLGMVESDLGDILACKMGAHLTRTIREGSIYFPFSEVTLSE